MKKWFLFFLFVSANAVHAADVRVAHLSPDAPAVDVLVGATDDAKSAVLEGVAFPAVSGYLPVADGNYFIDVVPAGGGDPVINVDDIALSGDLTIAAVNYVANIEPLVLVDDHNVVADKVKLRAVHASPNAPAVDIFVDGAGLLPQLTNLSFKDSTDYLTLDPGAYTFRFRATGSEDDVYVVNDLELSAGTNYSAFAIGELGTNFSVLPVVDAVPEPNSGIMMLLAVTLVPMLRRRK